MLGTKKRKFQGREGFSGNISKVLERKWSTAEHRECAHEVSNIATLVECGICLGKAVSAADF